MSQDFSRKIVIVVKDGVESWQLCNTIAHISAYLGNKIQDLYTRESIVSADGVKIPINTQYGIVALRANEVEIKELFEKLKNSSLLHFSFVQDMIDQDDDDELEKVLALKQFKDVVILGIGIFGSKDELKTLTGKYKLLK